MDELSTFRAALTAGAVGGHVAEAQTPVRATVRATDVRAVVLVEGVSDRAAVEALAGRLDRDLVAERVAVVPMGGVTNTDRFLRALGPLGAGLRVTALCDVGEVRFVRRGLAAAGLADGPAESPGFFVCVDDLEDELVRALGVAATEQLLATYGDLDRFRLFQRQPAQRGRAVENQLRRFLGTTSGRKALYARRMIDAMDLDRTPDPLIGLLTSV